MSQSTAPFGAGGPRNGFGWAFLSADCLVPRAAIVLAAGPVFLPTPSQQNPSLKKPRDLHNQQMIQFHQLPYNRFPPSPPPSSQRRFPIHKHRQRRPPLRSAPS